MPRRHGIFRDSAWPSLTDRQPGNSINSSAPTVKAFNRLDGMTRFTPCTDKRAFRPYQAHPSAYRILTNQHFKMKSLKVPNAKAFHRFRLGASEFPSAAGALAGGFVRCSRTSAGRATAALWNACEITSAIRRLVSRDAKRERWSNSGIHPQVTPAFRFASRLTRKLFRPHSLSFRRVRLGGRILGIVMMSNNASAKAEPANYAVSYFSPLQTSPAPAIRRRPYQAA